MAKPILISISPNTDCSDIKLAFRLVFQLWRWQDGKSLSQLKNKLKSYLKASDCWLLNSGRTGLYLALKALDLKATDEVLCQAFTCVAVPNAISWAGAKSVFIDTQKNGFNLDVNDLKKKVTDNSQAIIVQHTFGRPDDLVTIKKICQQHQLILIEDCAHSLGAQYQGKPVGSFGDVTMLSFGRDKVISSIFGGALLTNNPVLTKKINQVVKDLKSPPNWWIFKQLLHPLAMAVIVPLYFTLNLGKFSLGKGLLFLMQKLSLISWPVTKKEKQSQMDLKPRLLPNALAVLALNQLKKLGNINRKRQQIAKIYQQAFKLSPEPEGSINIRFPVLVDKPPQLINNAKKAQILLGNWYCPVIAPQGVNLEKIGYQLGSCPHAEAVSQKVVNLPTHPQMTIKDANRVIKVVKEYVVS